MAERPEETKKDWEFELLEEGEENILFIYLETIPTIPSIEDSGFIFGKTIDILTQIDKVTKIIFTQKRDYEYDFSQTQMLAELAQLYRRFMKDRAIFGYSTYGLTPVELSKLNRNYTTVQGIIYNTLKTDPVGAYVELKRLARNEKIELEKTINPSEQMLSQKYLALLTYLINQIEKIKIIQMVMPQVPGYQLGDRSIYRTIFSPTIKPDFMFTKLMADYPTNGLEIDGYMIGDDAEVTVFTFPDSIETLYHVIPPEFKLAEEKYELLDIARKIMAEHKPRREEFTEPKRMRQVFFNIGRDLMEELAENKGIRLKQSELDMLTNILVRYTVGFGLIEVLLQDEKIQDISVNSPMGKQPLYIVHGDYNECTTNIIPTNAEGESWATKLRMISGRPLDEADPILDTELELPGATTRVSVITRPLDPTGIAFSFRRHRESPWTLPLFMKYKMLTAEAAGLLSFLVDGTRTLLVCGTRSSGKTSFLGSLMVEIMKKYRVITIEDSVSGDSELLIRRKGTWERTRIGVLVDEMIKKYPTPSATKHEIAENKENIEIFAMDKRGKIQIVRPHLFIRHYILKPMYRIKTRTGKTIEVTGDHSLFHIGENAEIEERKASKIKKGDKIAVPKILHLKNKIKSSINLLENITKRDDVFIAGRDTKKLLKKQGKDILLLGLKKGYSKDTVKGWKARKLLPARILKELRKKGQEFKKDFFKIGENSIVKIPIELLLNKNVMIFFGLWIADGCYDKNSIIISCNDVEDREVVARVAKSFGLKIKMHSDGISYIINSKTLKIVMQEFLGFTGNAFTKRIPVWIFNTDKRQRGAFLRGIFSGDGCATDKEIVINLAGEGLLKDIQTLLLTYGIILRTGKRIEKDKTIRTAISSLDSIQKFSEIIGFLQKYKTKRLRILCKKSSTHDTTDTLNLSLKTRKELAQIFRNKFNQNDYITRENNIGRKKLAALLKEERRKNALLTKLNTLVKADIFWDEVKEISERKDSPCYVYDISVPGCESFICENIVAHNTLELPSKALRELGFNIQQIKVAAALARETTEMGAADGIRSTLRLGDSALIVGEVRSREAIALYEAMRIGAAANIVAGTIHSDSPYGVYDRVVNDIGVPKTSFKATDVIIVANPIRSADGLKRNRRITQITEVRKHWENDPLQEGGFMDLMKYNAKTDCLEATDAIINGESEILKAVAANIKEFAGNWDAVRDNIELRAKIKNSVLEYSLKTEKPEFLEAPFVIKANDKFHLLSESIKEELGYLDPKRIFYEFEEWLKKECKRL